MNLPPPAGEPPPPLSPSPAAPAAEAAWVRWLRGPGVLALAVVVAIALVAFSELGYRESRDQLGALVQMGRQRIELIQVSRLIADAESQQRVYLLNGRREMLQPYDAALAEMERRLEFLRQAYQGGAQGERLSQLEVLRGLLRDKISEMALINKLRDEGRTEDALAVVQLNRGVELMDAIRAQVDAMIERENRTIASGLSSIFDTLMLHRLGVAAMVAVSLLVLALHLRQRHAHERQLVAQRRLVQAERDRLEVEVAQRTAELTALTRHLETAREDERARLARELHDELGSLLTAAKLDVARIRPKLTQSAPDLLPRLGHLVESLNAGIALKRRIIEDLRPSTLSNLGLKAALEILCAEYAERSNVPVHAQIEDWPLSTSAELTAFRLVQESLTNIGKYAEARQIEVTLTLEDDWVYLEVRDDGKGFAVQSVGLQKHGLVGMRYRVEAEAGRLDVRSAPGLGTRICAWLPMADSAGEAPASAAARATPPTAAL